MLRPAQALEPLVTLVREPARQMLVPERVLAPEQALARPVQVQVQVPELAPGLHPATTTMRRRLEPARPPGPVTLRVPGQALARLKETPAGAGIMAVTATPCSTTSPRCSRRCRTATALRSTM